MSKFIHEPATNVRLMIRRLPLEVAHVRPYYSVRHTALILLVLPLLYGFALLGFRRMRGAPLAKLLRAGLSGHLLVIAPTVEDWDGRFLLYVFPSICVFSAGESHHSCDGVCLS